MNDMLFGKSEENRLVWIIRLAIFAFIVFTCGRASSDDPLPPGINSLKTEGGTKAKVRGNTISLFGDAEMPPDAILQIASRPLRDLFPRSGYCYKCGIPWAITTEHSTHYTLLSDKELAAKKKEGVPFISGKGCFPLCQSCWSRLDPETRLPYYRAHHERGIADAIKYKFDPPTDEEWIVLKAAVLEGK